MSKELVGVVGVVVGAILGGGAQIVNAWLQDKRARRVQLRAERRELYTQVIAAQYAHIAARVLANSLPVDDPAKTLENLTVTLDEISRARASLSIVAPKDTAEAGIRFLNTVAPQKLSSDPKDLSKELVAFQRLAQRDLGIKTT